MRTTKSKSRATGVKKPAGRNNKGKLSVPVIVERDEGGFVAYCPTLEGCHTQGKTYEDALENVKEAIEVYIEDLQAHGERLPSNEIVSFTTVEVCW